MTRVGAYNSDHNADKLVKKYGTLDWDKIREEYEARLDAEIARGVDNAETRRYLREKQASSPEESRPPATQIIEEPPRKRKYHGGGPKSYDRMQMKRLYVEEKMTAMEIAERTGAHYETVRLILKSLGVYDPARDRSRAGAKGGRPPKGRCSNGHDVTKDENVIIIRRKNKRDERACRACKQERDKRYN